MIIIHITIASSSQPPNLSMCPKKTETELCSAPTLQSNKSLVFSALPVTTMTTEAKSEPTQVARNAVESTEPVVVAAATEPVAVGVEEKKETEQPKSTEKEEEEKETEQPKSTEKEEEEEKKETEQPKSTEKEEEEEKKEEEPKSGVEVKKEEEAKSEESTAFKEESNFLSDLKESEKKALLELKEKVEDAILTNTLFPKAVEKTETVKEETTPETNENEKGKTSEKTDAVKEETTNEKAEASEKTNTEKEVTSESTENEKKEATEKTETEIKETVEKTDTKKEETTDTEREKTPETTDNEKEKGVVEEIEGGKDEKVEETKLENEVDKDVMLWGAPLLPSKGDEATHVVLLKFLRARDFKVKEAFEMIKSTLQWRKENKIDGILEEEISGAAGLREAAFMDSGTDREGHPICYNLYGVFANEELYTRTFASEETTEHFLRWRFQVMEKGIKKLDFKPGGASSILQITDLKNAPWISKKELRMAMRRAVGLLQDNYPEFVATNIFINVPFWYYAFNALLSPFLTQRTKSKFVFARPAKVTETLLRYLDPVEIPVQYGGLRRGADTEFEGKKVTVSELTIKSGATESIELPIEKVGGSLLWEIGVVGWEVNYKEEFVPESKESYTVIVQKGKRYDAQEMALRNSFRNNEPGKVVLTIDNNTYKKKRVLYRYVLRDV